MMHLKEVFHKLSKSLDVHVVLGIPLDSNGILEGLPPV